MLARTPHRVAHPANPDDFDFHDVAGLSLEMPAGVPVATMSPGSSVMTCEMYDSSSGIGNTISALVACWRTWSFTCATSSRAPRFTGPRSTSPIGQNVSNPFARVHWPSFRCRSRAVTSLSADHAPDRRVASSSVACRDVDRSRFRSRPRDPTCADCGGSSIESPSADDARRRLEEDQRLAAGRRCPVPWRARRSFGRCRRSLRDGGAWDQLSQDRSQRSDISDQRRAGSVQQAAYDRRRI